MPKKMRRLIGAGSVALLLTTAVVAAQDRPRPTTPAAPTGAAVPRHEAPAVQSQSEGAFVPDLNGGGGAATQGGLHPVIGSWFGRAIQICPQGVAASACAFGLQAPTLFMTPTLNADGNFLGNDTFAISGPPFGPHTTAHGSWIGTSSTEFAADYVFMVPVWPPKDNAFVPVRFQWRGQVIDAETAVGYVNAWFLDDVPLQWVALGDSEFPAIPSGATAALKPPTGFFKDPTQCPDKDSHCPLVFKFTIKRVHQ